jgi:hypothetical protein
MRCTACRPWKPRRMDRSGKQWPDGECCALSGQRGEGLTTHLQVPGQADRSERMLRGMEAGDVSQFTRQEVRVPVKRVRDRSPPRKSVARTEGIWLGCHAWHPWHQEVKEFGMLRRMKLSSAVGRDGNGSLLDARSLARRSAGNG